MARAPRPYLAAAVAAALHLACGRAPGPPGSGVGISADAAVGRPSRLDASAETGGEATFTADMTHPGMVPLVAKASESEPGLYVATVTWTMAGDWVVHFEARWPDGRKTESRGSTRVSR